MIVVYPGEVVVIRVDRVLGTIVRLAADLILESTRLLVLPEVPI